MVNPYKTVINTCMFYVSNVMYYRKIAHSLDALDFRKLYIKSSCMAMRFFLSKLQTNHPQDFKLLVNRSTVASVIK
jgi:hypothetical protein